MWLRSAKLSKLKRRAKEIRSFPDITQKVQTAFTLVTENTDLMVVLDKKVTTRLERCSMVHSNQDVSFNVRTIEMSQSQVTQVLWDNVPEVNKTTIEHGVQVASA